MRWLHLLNYIIFALAIFRGLALGPEGKMLATRVVFSVFLALSVAGLAYRFIRPEWRQRFKTLRRHTPLE